MTVWLNFIHPHRVLLNICIKWSCWDLGHDHFDPNLTLEGSDRKKGRPELCVPIRIHTETHGNTEIPLAP